MRFLGLVILLFSLLASFESAAKLEKIKVYRWIDEKGVVTFSEFRPQNVDYVELEVEGDRVRTTARQADGSEASSENVGVNVGSDAVQELNSQATQYCSKAQHNIKVLDSFKNVRVLDDKGNPKVLTKADVAQQRALATRQIELFCKN